MDRQHISRLLQKFDRGLMFDEIAEHTRKHTLREENRRLADAAEQDRLSEIRDELEELLYRGEIQFVEGRYITTQQVKEPTERPPKLPQKSRST
jgi:hypothetical protein